MYFFLLSLLPLWPAIELLQYALDVRRAAKCGQEVCASGPSAATVRNALLVAIVEISFCMLATLRQFTKVLGLRGEGLHCGTYRWWTLMHNFYSAPPFPRTEIFFNKFARCVGCDKLLYIIPF